jgi:hypothetical protein
MAKRLTNTVITGDDKRLGLYFYYSPHFGHNIIRKTTSLTGARVKTDIAFKGFRESINRMKQASPIAASLYKLIPEEIKQYSIYRLLTSEALTMIKAGLDTGIIIENLKRLYIEPLINDPGKDLNQKEKFEPETDHHEKGLKSFIQLPDQKPNNQVRQKRRRFQMLQHDGQTREFQTNPEFAIPDDRHVSERIKILRLAQEKCKKAPKAKGDKIPGLLYLCRLRECKTLKLSVRMDGFPGVSG